MITIPVKTRLEADGVLSLHLPTGLPESDVEVIVIVQPVVAQTSAWPEDFFRQTFGAFADCPIERGTQGVFENREILR